MRSITLIGMPGAGKSTIGKILADRIGFRFIDLDILIKEKEGVSHAKIAKKRGDGELMRVEEAYTLSLDFDKVIFSPGGSIVYSPRAMEKIQKESKIIYLDLPLSEIKTRLGKNINKRGIVGLAKKGIEGLFSERTPLYKFYAHQTIDCFGLGDKEVVQKIYALLQH